MKQIALRSSLYALIVLYVLSALTAVAIGVIVPPVSCTCPVGEWQCGWAGAEPTSTEFLLSQIRPYIYILNAPTIVPCFLLFVGPLDVLSGAQIIGASLLWSLIAIIVCARLLRRSQTSKG